MANFVQLRDDFGDAFSRSFAQSRMMAEQERERKRQEEANASLYNAFMQMEKERRDATLAPQIADATKAGNAFQTAEGNLTALSAPITTPDGAGIKDTRAVRAILKDPQGMDKLNAMQTPEMPVDTTQLQSYNQALAPAMQAQVNQLSAQNNTAQDLLSQAEANYPSSVLEKLAPFVARGVPAQQLIQMAEKWKAEDTAKNIEKQEKEVYKLIGKATDEEIYTKLSQINPNNKVAMAYLEKILKKGGTAFSLGARARAGEAIWDGTKWIIPNPKVEKPDKPTKPGNYREVYDEETGATWWVSLDDPNARQLKTQGRPFHKELLQIEKDEKNEIAQHNDLKPTGLTARPDEVKAWNDAHIAIQNKYAEKKKAVMSKKATTGSTSLGDPLMDATLAEIRLNGAEAAQAKLTTKFGAEKAKQIMAQISLLLQEN